MIFLNSFYLIWQCGGLFGCIMMLESGAIDAFILILILLPIGTGFPLVYAQFKMIKYFLISQLENAKGRR